MNLRRTRRGARGEGQEERGEWVRIYVCGVPHMRIYTLCVWEYGYISSGNTLQHTAWHCKTLQHTATHCNTLHHAATHCNTLQHTATQCHTMQHTVHVCVCYIHIEWWWPAGALTCRSFSTQKHYKYIFLKHFISSILQIYIYGDDHHFRSWWIYTHAYMCIYIYVCIYIYIHIYIYIYIYMHLYVCIHIYIFRYTYTNVYVHVHMYTFICVFI